MVTHLTTNPPVHRLSTAERTGSAIVDVLWSYVEVFQNYIYITTNVSKSTTTWSKDIVHLVTGDMDLYIMSV